MLLVSNALRKGLEFVRRFRQERFHLQSMSLIHPSPNYDYNAEAESLWAEYPEIGNLKLHKMSFIRLLYRRVMEIQHFYEGAQNRRRQGYATYSARDPHFYPKLFRHTLSEIAVICKGNMSGDWTKIEQGFLCLGSDGCTANMLYLSGEPPEDENRLTVSVLDRKTAEENPVRLRVDLAPGLEVGSERMVSILQRSSGYILTPDFALKLFILNQRRKAGIPTLLSGDTGVGKTEILRVLMEILNSGNSAIPDFFFELKSALIGDILLEFEDLLERYGHFVQKIGERIILKGYDESANKKDFLKKILEEIFLVAGQDAPRLARRLIEYSTSLLKDYPLLTVPAQLSKRLQQLDALTLSLYPAPAKRKGPSELPERPFVSEEAQRKVENLLPQILNDIIIPSMKLTPEKLFKKKDFDE